MESLPVEILLKIISNLNFQDLLKCRLVSHRFKAVTYNTLKSLTHLALQKVKTEDRILFPGFLSEDLVHCNLKYSSELVAFLASYCPHLLVLYAPYSKIKFEELQPLTNSLKFFYCSELQTQMTIRCEIVSLINNFVNLEAFFCVFGSYAYDLVSSILTTKLLNERKPIVHRVNHSYINLSSSGLDSIHFTQNIISIPDGIRKNLRCLRIHTKFISDEIWLQGSLQSLEYLYLGRNYKNNNTMELNEKLFSSPKLKAITCNDRSFSPRFMRGLLLTLDSYEQLECINLNCDETYENKIQLAEEEDDDVDDNYRHSDEEEEEHNFFNYEAGGQDDHLHVPSDGEDQEDDDHLSGEEGNVNNHPKFFNYNAFKVSLPSNLKVFKSFKIRFPLQVTCFNPSSLRLLICRDLLYLQGEFPQLEILKISVEKHLKKQWVKMTSISLSTCVNLRCFKITTRTNSILPIFRYSLRMLNKLEDFSIHFEETSGDDQLLIQPSKFSLFLPSGITSFLYTGQSSLHLMNNNYNFTCLRRFICANLGTLGVEFPDVEELDIYINKEMSEDDTITLSNSISGCTELKSLRMTIQHGNDGLVYLQPIVNSIESLKKLEHVSFLYNDFFDYERTNVVNVRLGGVKLTLPFCVRVFNTPDLLENPDIIGRNRSSFIKYPGRNLRAFTSHLPHLKELVINIYSLVNQRDGEILFEDSLFTCVELKSVVIQVQHKNNRFIYIQPMINIAETLDKLEVISFNYQRFQLQFSKLSKCQKTKFVKVISNGVKAYLPFDCKMFNSPYLANFFDGTDWDDTSIFERVFLSLRSLRPLTPFIEELELDLSGKIGRITIGIFSFTISSCVKLRYLTFHSFGSNSYEDVKLILASIAKHDKLEYLSLNFKNNEKILTNIRIVLPPNIKTFETIGLWPSLAISGQYIALRKIFSENLYCLDGHFPRLEELNIRFNRHLEIEQFNILSRSISRCIELNSLVISFHVSPPSLNVQIVIDSLQNLNKIHTVSFDCNDKIGRHNTGPAILIDQLKIASIENFHWFLPHKILLTTSWM